MSPTNEKGNIIELHDVAVTQEDNVILRDVNIEIKQGSFVYLVGRVGSGKSSFLKTLYAELPFCGESGFVAGYDLATLKAKDVPFLRRALGIVFQDFQLLSDRSVFHNLEFVLRATGWKDKNGMDRRIREVLTEVDMVHKGYKMPHQLSGGEQQRIAIARAMLNSPDLILADEPTGNLDPETTNQLMDLLVRINQQGKTIVMATHNMNVVQNYPATMLHFENSLVGV